MVHVLESKKGLSPSARVCVCWGSTRQEGDKQKRKMLRVLDGCQSVSTYPCSGDHWLTKRNDAGDSVMGLVLSEEFG